MQCKDMPLLKEKVRAIFDMAVWPTAAVTAPLFDNYLTTVEAAEGTGSDTHGQLKAHVAIEEAKLNISKHLKEADKWHGILEAHQASIAECDNVVAMYTARTATKGKQSTAGKTGGPFVGKDTMEKICFKCGVKGHMYQACTVTKTPVCAICTQQHHTNVHDLVLELKAKRFGKAAPWTATTKRSIEGNLCSLEDFMNEYEQMLQEGLDDEDDIEAMVASMGRVKS